MDPSPLQPSGVEAVTVYLISWIILADGFWVYGSFNPADGDQRKLLNPLLFTSSAFNCKD